MCALRPPYVLLCSMCRIDNRVCAPRVHRPPRAHIRAIFVYFERSRSPPPRPGTRTAKTRSAENIRDPHGKKTIYGKTLRQKHGKSSKTRQKQAKCTEERTSVGKNGPWWAKMLDGPWWARMTAREARRTRKRLCIRWSTQK